MTTQAEFFIEDEDRGLLAPPHSCLDELKREQVLAGPIRSGLEPVSMPPPSRSPNPEDSFFHGNFGRVRRFTDDA